jgi:demethylmenaquinone methyltransferase/2-methoxy-6-polyprenyl-1,4-benzoquinol methylase
MAQADRAALLDEQARYYAARAEEYDDWWFRRGRYDRGPEATARWRAEAAEVEAALAAFGPRGDVLELACGTGLWTERLAQHADRVDAVDAAPAVLDVARRRLDRTSGRAEVRLLQADLFAWSPPRRYDAVVFAHWLSHVPDARFAAFWDVVADALVPGGRAFLVDSRRTTRSTATDHVQPGQGKDTMVRRLDDGRAFRIVKRFWEPAALAAELAELGRRTELTATEEFFVYGSATRVGPATRPSPATRPGFAPRAPDPRQEA